MFSGILYKALLKLSKENTDNNYIYSDIDFPENFIKQKTKRDKQEKIMNYKNLFTTDRFFSQNKANNTRYKNSPILLNIRKKKLKINSNDSNLCYLDKINSLNKNKSNAFSLLPKVNNYHSSKNSNKVKEIQFNFPSNFKSLYNNHSKNYNLQNSSLELTPKKKKSFVFERNIMMNKKLLNNINLNSNNDSGSAINIHILNINAPRDKMQKDFLSISRNILSQKNYIENKKLFNKIISINSNNKKIIQIKRRERYRRKEKEIKKEGLMHKIQAKIIYNSKIRRNKKSENTLSFSLPKPTIINRYQPKMYPMIAINNYREKYIPIDYIENIVIKQINDFPLYKIIPSNNYDTYYYALNKMYVSQMKDYMRHRINWEHISERQASNEKNVNINFSWRYYSNRIYYKKYKYDPGILSSSNNYYSSKKLKMVNLFEKNYEVGNKKYMFLNLIKYCDKINMNVFDIIPFTILINNSPEVELGLEALKDLVLFVEKNSDPSKNLITNRKYNEHFCFF